MPQSKTSRSPYQVQVLDRALALLDILSRERKPLSLVELSEKLQLHKSTVHRLVMVLERHRVIDKHEESGRYSLGLKLFELGSKAVAQVDLRERARPFLERVVYEANETVHLCILDDDEVLYLDKVEPTRSVRMASSVGRRNPAYCTAVGKAMLTDKTERQVDEVIRRYGLKPLTKNTRTTPAELKADLEAIRKRGYAVDDEENEEGVRCVGAPVRNYSGQIVAAISVSGPAFRVSQEKVPVIAKSVMEAAAGLSRQLGFEPSSRKTKIQIAGD